MPGPAPKSANQRQRRNRTTTAASLEAPPATKVPLPDIRWSSIKCQACLLPKWRHVRRYFEDEDNPVEPHDFDPMPIEWRPTTLQWWKVIWASPMAEEWVDADVPGLLAHAILVDEFWTFGDSKIHAEMRQASREFGLSPLSRRQLQWEIKRLEGPKAPRREADRSKPRGGLSVLEGKLA